MKKYVVAVIVCTAVTGLFFVYKYLNETYFPKKRMDEVVREQKQLFSDISPQKNGKDDTDNPLYKCKQINSDTVGWITIPGTNIDYPIVQGEDNDFYLYHGLDGEENYGLGVPFLDYRCEGGFNGFNAVVYGHHITERRMFSDISLFKDSDFMKSHSTGELITDDGIHEIAFFAYLTVPSNSPVYDTVFLTEQDKMDYIDLIYNEAAYIQNIPAEELKSSSGTLHFILLSTCTYEYDEARGVLIGVIR